MNTRRIRGITLIVVLSGLAACAAQPPQTTDATPSAQAAPVTPAAAAAPVTAPTPAAAAPATASAAPAEAGAAGEPVVKIPSGYRLVKRGGQELYCRSETTIGTRFPETLCYTREQMKVIAERTDEVMDVIGRGCVGGGCGDRN
jgi:nucleoid-associated protein YgaU